MKKLLILLLACGLSNAAIVQVVKTKKGAVSGANVTTDAVDTTGANFLIVGIAWWNGAASTPGVTDARTGCASPCNTWTALTAYSDGTNSVQFFYAKNATGSAGHQITTTGLNGGYSIVLFRAYSGVDTSAPFDVQNGITGAYSSNTICQAGSITPAGANELLVALYGADTASAAGSIDSSFTDLDALGASSGNYAGGATAYLVYSGTSAQNPTWTNSGGTNEAACTIAAFKPGSPSTPAPSMKHKVIRTR